MAGIVSRFIVVALVVYVLGSMSGLAEHSCSSEHGDCRTVGGYHNDHTETAILEEHLLRMLRLSQRPVVNRLPVPEYMKAMQHALETEPPAPVIASQYKDQVMWALKAAHVTVDDDVITMSFDLSTKSRDIGMASRVELVFESATLLTTSTGRRGRATVEVCHAQRVRHRRCIEQRHVRYRLVDTGSRRYFIYDLSVAMASWMPVCLQAPRKPCTGVELQIHGGHSLDVADTTTILVVYQNLVLNTRATRRALRAAKTAESRLENTQSRWENPELRHSADDRYRRGAVETSPYCQLHSWTVNFRELNWTWVVAPHHFQAGYCAGRCPSSGRDLERAQLTNHAFLRMIHRVWRLNKLLPAPTCVPIRYNPLNILYRSSDSTFELRHVTEMISVSCGCL